MGQFLHFGGNFWLGSGSQTMAATAHQLNRDSMYWVLNLCDLDVLAKLVDWEQIEPYLPFWQLLV